MSTVIREGVAPLTDEQPIVTGSMQVSGAVGETPATLFVYLLFGMLFGFVLIKSEAVSWFRIQEMFRFQSFHMYGIIGSAILVGATSLQVIRRLQLRTARGEPIVVPPKERTPMLRRYWIGGSIFGLGWALLGACPGPLFALIGTGATVMLVPFGSALAGTWAYGQLRTRLPH